MSPKIFPKVKRKCSSIVSDSPQTLLKNPAHPGGGPARTAGFFAVVLEW
jgi:hypothetical protein